MKNLTILIAVFCLFIGTTNAQKFGLKVGANVSSFDASDPEVSVDALTGFHIGPVLDIDLIGPLGLNTGVLYSQKGYKAKVTFEFLGETITMEENAKLNYIDIPVNLSLGFGLSEAAKIFVQAGPNFGIGLNGKAITKVMGMGEEEEDEEDIEFGSEEEQIKKLNTSIGIGAGVKISKIVLGVNYNIGLSNLSNYGDGDEIKNNVFQGSVAFMF
jgi:hypothetical protein